jgi:hypothetical protein
LYNATGTNIVNAPSDIEIVLEVYTDGIFSPVTITIPSGQPSGSDDIYVLVWDDCGERNESFASTIDGIWSTPANITECVTPTPTPTPLNRFYIASPVADIDETYCVTPGYVLTGALWSSATTISGLMNQQVYLDQYGDDVFIGVEGYKYAVSLTAGINTFTDGSANYELIQIYENGTVWNVLSPNCGSSGGGGDVPL